MGKKSTSAADDQLVIMHRKARVRKKRRLLITVIVVCVVVILTILIGVNALRSTVTSQVNNSANDVESAEVTVGNISTTVSGSGTLSADSVETLEIAKDIEVSKYYVEAGDKVEEGDLIATVTNASLLSAMSAKQTELDELDEKLEEASAEEVSDTISTSLAGRVKKIFAAEDADVATTMYESGALMLLSLDGYMAVDISAETLTVGNSVSVTLSDGTLVDGLVEKVVNKVAKILVTDNGTTYEDEVKVSDSEGNELGNGKLYIHNQFSIVGYAGTVDSIEVSENEKVSAGETLIELTDTETTVNYDALLKERVDLEKELDALIKIYKEGGIYAPFSGIIESLESASDSSSSFNMYGNQSTAGNEITENTTVATISPDTTMAITISIDESDILSLEVGQEASVSIDSISDETFAGVVAEVNTLASSDSGVTSYSAVIHLDKTANMLSGMSASVVVTIEGRENALLIPVDALHQTSTTAYVYTAYDEETGEFSGMKEVSIGLSNSTYVEITEGLEEGETVYYTESEDSSMFGGMMNFGNMGGMGNMPSFDAGSMPGGQGGGFSGFGGNGNSMPNTGNRPSGGR